MSFKAIIFIAGFIAAAALGLVSCWFFAHALIGEDKLRSDPNHYSSQPTFDIFFAAGGVFGFVLAALCWKHLKELRTRRLKS